MASQKPHNSRTFTGDDETVVSPSCVILLVNECADAGIEQILGICLERMMGWKIISVSPTEQGLVLPLNQKPDAVLFNARLSRQHNLSFVQKQIIRQLKQSPLTQTSPILLLIDTANWMTVQQLKSLGVVGAIAKPFNPVTLPKEISKLLVIHQENVD